MSFGWPAGLLGLLVIPLAIAAYVAVQRRRSRYAVRFTNLDLLASVVRASPGWRRHVPPALYLLAVTALVLALSRPERTVDVAKEEATVILVMDTSGSMTATDVEPSRLAAAKSAAGTLVEDLPEKFRIALISFSTGVETRVPPTEDRDAVLAALESLGAVGGTAMGDALQHAVAMASQHDSPLDATGNGSSDGEAVPEDSPSVIVLLSDGYNTLGSNDPLGVAGEAAGLGIPVFTIALGTEDGVAEVVDERGFRRFVPVPPDEETLRAIAEETGAEFHSAPTAGDLRGIYDDLGSKIGYDEEQREVTAWFAAGAAVLVLAAGSLALLWFNRFP